MNYYLIGIKGAGLSALALILKNLGNEVSGYDDEAKHQFTEDKLNEAGIKVYTEENDEINSSVIVIRSTAINQNKHPQILKAKEYGCKIYEYMEFLGELTKQYQTIAICGTHGKTTTSTMLKEVIAPVLGCNYLIGDGTGYANPNNQYFLIEACEYRRNFLAYFPKISIITNVDLDHVDYYSDIDDISSAFSEFADKTEDLVIVYGDDEKSRKLHFETKRLYYGINSNNDIYAQNINYSEKGISFDVFINNELYHHFSLPFYGEHNLLNSLAVIGLCNYLNISKEDIQKYLSKFSGAIRRFNETTVGNTIIIDDYAHHPKEIKTTILAAKQKYQDKKTIVVFEPHTFSRVKMFYKEISESLNIADEVYVLDIFKSRENPNDYPDITSKLIVDNLDNGHYLKRTSNELSKHKGEVIMFMSPKEMRDIIDSLINNLKGE